MNDRGNRAGLLRTTDRLEPDHANRVVGEPPGVAADYNPAIGIPGTPINRDRAGTGAPGGPDCLHPRLCLQTDQIDIKDRHPGLRLLENQDGGVERHVDAARDRMQLGSPACMRHSERGRNIDAGNARQYRSFLHAFPSIPHSH